MSRGRSLVIAALAAPLYGQTVQVVKVESKPISRMVTLTGEIIPFQAVALHARVQGFVDQVLVDRGSVVKEGAPLLKLSAPEMDAQVAEARAKVTASEAAASQARAKCVAAESTFARLEQASAVEGAIAGNELVIAEQAAAASRDALRSSEAAVAAARASLGAVEKMQLYLSIRAPFSGVVTERLVHPGALAGPGTGPLLRLEQVTRLRLVVAVPEGNVSGIERGAQVPFQVPAYPARTFTGTVARVARSVDPRTRTMAVEVDVPNGPGLLAPGMYPQVRWPTRPTESVLVVPATSVVRTSERLFVIRVHNGRAEWVDVRLGARADGQIEVLGGLVAGDPVVRNGSDEIRDGAPLPVTNTKS